MTNLRSLPDVFRAAMKLAAACAFATAIAPAAAGQTNTFPTTGNAGAGTTTPDRKLEVLDSGSPQLRLTHTDGSVYTDFQTTIYGLLISPTGVDTTSTKPFTVAADSDAFRFYSNVDTNLRWSLTTDASGFFHVAQKGDSWVSQGARLSINRSGNVGIGTTPGALYRLDVQGKINSSELCIATDCKSSWSQVSGGPSSFSSITAGTNTGTLLVGSGGSLGVNGSGTINATTLGGATFAAPGAIGATTPGTGAFSAVGINTVPSSYKLDVNGNTNFTGNINVAGTGNITASGTIEAGNIKAKFQDLAEWVPSSEQLAAGTVVVLDTTKSNQVISSNAAYDTRVAGVISAQPGITLGERGEGKVLVATTGRVRVKVDASRGPIQIGDLLVTSDISGVAMKSEAVNLGAVQIHRPGTIIGKALEPLAKGKGEILALLSLQ